MQNRGYTVKCLGMLALGTTLGGLLAVPAAAQRKAEKTNMELVGHNDLQGRSAYMPVIQKQGDRWIAYVGGQNGGMPKFNSLTGQLEPNGTSVVDVTDPKNPKYLANIPGEFIMTGTGDRQEALRTAKKAEVGGAQYMRVCPGSTLPRADKNKFYMIRNFGRVQWETWDVTDPAKPSRINVIISGALNTHRVWWECDTGVAYIVSGPFDWRVPAGDVDRRFDGYDHMLVYDMSDPTKPTFIRTFGLPGQNPGSALPVPSIGLHTLISTGPKGNRLYLAHGNAENGILEIVDREKLLKGPKEPTDDNLRYPVISRMDLPPDMGVHTPFPLIGMPLPEFAKQRDGFVKDFVAITGQGHNDNKECHESRQMLRIFDITTEKIPVGVSTWTVPEASGNFCTRGAVFGTHGTQENFSPVYYKRVLFVSHHNAGVRALDIRDPYNPKEIAHYIPGVTDKTEPSCYGQGADRHCKTEVDTNNVEIDDRGYIYIVDFAGTGLHILQLTGAARQLADFTQAVR